MGAAAETALALGHAGVSVSDMDRSLRFYESGLGLTCVGRRVVEADYILRIVAVEGTTGIEVAMLATADGRIAVELLRYLGAAPGQRGEHRSAPGTGHLCLFVDDIALAMRRGVAAGGAERTSRPVEVESGPYQGALGCYLEDPDGYPVELVQPSLRMRERLADPAAPEHG